MTRSAPPAPPAPRRTPPARPSRRDVCGLLVAPAAAAGLAAVGLPARAQSPAWPTRTVRIVAPWNAGSGTDIVTRVVAEKLRVDLGQSVVVENRAGAAGNLGAEFVARQPADGHTLMMTSASFAIAPSLYRSLSFDPVRDFAPVTKLATAPLLVLVRAESSMRTMADLVEAAKRKPDGVTYASFGNGSPSHLIGESINALAGVSMRHVPYNGTQAALDLAAGTVDVAILDALSQTPQVKAGKLRALALNGRNRLPALPDVPTLVESGIPFDTVGWHALFAPAGTPREVVARINAAVNRVVAMPDVQARIHEAGSFPVSPPTTPEQWGEQFAADVRTWAELVRRSGATIS